MHHAARQGIESLADNKLRPDARGARGEQEHSVSTSVHFWRKALGGPGLVGDDSDHNEAARLKPCRKITRTVAAREVEDRPSFRIAGFSDGGGKPDGIP